jgi:hypothetical protein
MILAAMTIGEAVAGPTHAHRHRHLHEKKDLSDVKWSALHWDDMGIDWASAYAAGQHTSTSTTPVATPPPVVTPATTPSAAAPAATHTDAPAAAAGAVFSEVKSAFSGLVGMANGLTKFGSATPASGTGIDHVGNIGDTQGSNMIQVASTAGQDFTITFINTSGAAMTVVIWNKAYKPDGGATQANQGAFMAPTHPALTINLAPGASGIAAFMAESQGCFAQATDRIAASGAYATTWGEFNFVPGGSGYDMSAIMNSLGNKYSMTITSEEAPQCTSDPTQNYWTTNTGYPDGTPKPIGNSDGSCYIAQNTAHLTVKMGGDMS